MATITVHKSVGMDMKGFDFSDVMYADDFYSSTSFFIAYDYGNDARVEFRGSGFKYDAYGEPVVGNVTSLGIYHAGNRLLAFDGFKASAKKLVDVAMTYSSSDDLALIKGMLSGNDKISGGGKTDVLYGYNGNDKITGNGGGDKLYGGAGSDTFIFKKLSDSTVAAAGRDKLYDFSQSQKDKIDLSSIDANSKAGGNQAFKFIGDDDFNKKAGELSYEKKNGDTFIFGDVNGDGKADFSIVLDPSISLKAGDFIL